MARSEKEKENAKRKRSGWEKFVVSVKSLLKVRATTNISLLMVNSNLYEYDTLY
jgi:hypothetical protein